ncbi:hypothetical protein BLA29_015188, partial [Euroglyphus maynei]
MIIALRPQKSQVIGDEMFHQYHNNNNKIIHRMNHDVRLIDHHVIMIIMYHLVQCYRHVWRHLIHNNNNTHHIVMMKQLV